MDAVVVSMVLLGSVCSVPSIPPQTREPKASFSVVFSEETRLLVTYGGETIYDDDDSNRHHHHHHHRHHNRAAGCGPQVQIMSPVPLSADPESPRLLVCILRGLRFPLQDVLWWVDEQIMTASVQVKPEKGEGYIATSLWEVSAEEWRTRSKFWCGTVEDGRVYRKKLCSKHLNKDHNFT